MLKKRVVLIVLLFSCVWVRGSHDIRGRVVDDLRLPVPGVLVELKSVPRGEILVTTADKDGRYYFDCVSDGHHALTLKNPGFLETTVKVKYYYPSELNLSHQISVDRYAGHVMGTPGKFLFSVRVLDANTRQPVPEAALLVNGLVKEGSTDRCGRLWNFLENGEHLIEVRRDGFSNAQRTLTIKGERTQLTIFVSPD